MTADEALHAHGLGGRQRLGIARDVANHAAGRFPYCSETTRENLASYLTEVGVRQALAYHPARSGDGYSFASFLWDVLNRRVTDYFRKKAEGHGDRRHGNDRRVDLVGGPPVRIRAVS